MNTFTIFTTVILLEAIVLIGAEIKYHTPYEFSSASAFVMYAIGFLYTVVHSLKIYAGV